MLEVFWGASGALLAGLAVQFLEQQRAQQRQRQWNAALPAQLQRLASQLDSGSGLNRSMSEFCEAVGATELAQIHRDGLRWSEALQTHEHPDLRLLGRLVSIYEASGSDLSGAVIAMANRLTQRERAASLARVAVAPVMGQARMLLIVMPALIGMIALFEPAATLMLFTTYMGLSVLAGCILLNAGMWMVFRGIARQIV